MSLFAPRQALSAPQLWAPFAERREVSSSGARYVVLKSTREGILEFELCARRAGAPPIRAAVGAVSEIARDPADGLLAKGRSDQLPMEVVVGDAPAGLLLFEHYGQLGRGSALRWIDDKGTVSVDLTRAKLFGRGVETAAITAPTLIWHAHVSLDETRRSAVVVALDGEAREVALPAGTVTTPDVRQIAAWCMSGHLGRRLAMLDVLATRGRDALEIVGPALIKIVANEVEPTMVRLRAGFALRTLGHERDVAPLFLAACADGASSELRDYAFERLPIVLGAAAVPYLESRLADKERLNSADSAALVNLGRVALPALADLLDDDDVTSEGRMVVLYALDSLDSRPAREAQLRALTAKDLSVARQAVAFLRIHYADWMSAPLIDILDRGGLVDDDVAGVFIQHPVAAALPALRKALQRARARGSAHAYLDQALVTCAATR